MKQQLLRIRNKIPRNTFPITHEIFCVLYHIINYYDTVSSIAVLMELYEERIDRLQILFESKKYKEESQILDLNEEFQNIIMYLKIKLLEYQQ